MGERKLVTRLEWLAANGFERDPFELNSFRAETDPLFGPSELLSYVDRRDHDLLTGIIKDFDNSDLDKPGYHFIFSQPGGGKSSLRRRIHSLYDNPPLFNSVTQVLIIDYIDHSYSIEESEIQHHVGRIIHLAQRKLGIDFSKEKMLSNKSPVLALENSIRLCKRHGILRVYILVDDLDIQSFQKIISLAEVVEIFKIKGLIIKFFLPENLLLPSQALLPFYEFPPYILSWESNELSQVLDQRLIACLDPGTRVTSGIHPISFLVEGYLDATIQDSLVKLGELGNSPRLMWQLGNYLLEEHTDNKTNFDRSKLINHEVFARARLRLFDDLIRSGMVIGHRYYGRFDSGRKRVITESTSSKQKGTIFLCYAEKDEELLLASGLYEELLVKNFRPWMRKDIFPGEDLTAAIKSAVRKSDFFLLCLSSRSGRERGQFQKELKWAQEIQGGMKDNDIFIIPVRLMKCNLPDSVQHMHTDWFIESQRERLFAAFEEGKLRRRRKK